MKYDFVIDNSGYEKAINYYANLKEQFLNQIKNQIAINGKRGVKSSYNKIINSITDKVSNSFSPDDGKTSFELLNEIFDSFAKTDEISNFQEIAMEKFKKKYNEEEGKNKNIRNAFVKSFEQGLMSSDKNLTEMIKTTLIRVIDTSKRDFQSSTLQALVEKANQMFRIAILAYLEDPNRETYILKGLPSITLQGYLREQLELNALKKIFNKSGLNVVHGGTKKVGGLETEFDNILSFMNNIDNSFNQQVNGTTELLLDENVDINNLLSKINYYGEQVKSFNLGTKKIGKTFMAGVRITEDAILQKELQAQSNYITLKQNLLFMAKFNHIIKAFGPATILFSSGAGRQWMDEFIKDFRTNNYYLLFRYNKRGQINSTIELNVPILSNKKNRYYKSRWN